MDYNPDPGDDDDVLSEHNIDDSEVPYEIWTALEQYVERANELHQYIKETNFHTPNTWGWPKYMYNVAEGALRNLELDHRTLRTVGEDTVTLQEMENNAMMGLFLSAGYNHLKEEQIKISDSPPNGHKSHRGYAAFDLDSEKTVVFISEDTSTRLGMFNSGTCINEGIVSHMGGKHMDGVLINNGDAECMRNYDGITINNGNVNFFTTYHYDDTEDISINYGSAHHMHAGNGVMINFGDTEPEPYESWDGGFEGSFFQSVGVNDPLCINYGEVTGDRTDNSAWRNHGVMSGSDGTLIAVNNPENGVEGKKDARVIDEQKLAEPEYTELRQYLECLEDLIGPENETEDVISRLQAIDPSPNVRIKTDINEILESDH